MENEIHVYDDAEGVLYLSDGREIDVNPRQFTSVDQAVAQLDDWAKRRNFIGQNDLIASF